MKEKIETLYHELELRVQHEEIGVWHTISENDVKLFGEITHNTQFIHTNAARTQRESPYDGLIAHAYLVLALIPHLASSMSPLSRLPIVALNYGFDRARFPEATKIGAEVRAHRTLASIEKREKGVLVTQEIVVEQKGVSRPSVSARSLLFLIPISGK